MISEVPLDLVQILLHLGDEGDEGMVVLSPLQHFLQEVVGVKNKSSQFLETNQFSGIFGVVDQFEPVAEVLNLTCDADLGIFYDWVGLHPVDNFLHLLCRFSAEGFHQEFQVADFLLIAPQLVSHFLNVLDDEEGVLIVFEDGVGEVDVLGHFLPPLQNVVGPVDLGGQLCQFWKGEGVFKRLQVDGPGLLQFHLDLTIQDVTEFAPQTFVLLDQLLNIAVPNFNIGDIAKDKTSPMVGQGDEVRSLVSGCFVG